MEKKIHIVSFDVPYPPNYGGVMDVYNRIKALHKNGYKIHLHSFEYGRGRQEALNTVCSKLDYYKRSSKLTKSLSKTPMIVSSRKNKTLLENLLKDNAPILFEGQHCTAFLGHQALKNRTKLVRIHNVEHHYYKFLAESEPHFLKKQYYLREAKKLKTHEVVLKHANHLLCISKPDVEYYAKKFKTTLLLPAAINIEKQDYIGEKENFCLFHGNLSVSENTKAVNWILNEVLPFLNTPLVIAGKNPNRKLVTKIAKLDGVRLVSNPDKTTLDKLLNTTKSHLLITFQNTGIKLKLLNALCTSGKVVANSKMLSGTGLESLCDLEEEPKNIAEVINETSLTPISENLFRERIGIIEAIHGSLNQVKIIKPLLENND